MARSLLQATASVCSDAGLLLCPFRAPLSARGCDNLLPSYSNMFLVPFITGTASM